MRHTSGLENDETEGSPLMLWLKTFYEAVGLPKLNSMAINGDLCEPSRVLLIRAADIDPINNVAVRSDHIGTIFFHRTPSHDVSP
jgi:hypothetical protein